MCTFSVQNGEMRRSAVCIAEKYRESGRGYAAAPLLPNQRGVGVRDPNSPERKTQIQDKHHEKSYRATGNEKTHDAQTVQSLSAHRGMLADTKKPRKEAGLRL